MTSIGTNGHVNGMSNGHSTYSIPGETQKVFEHGVLKNNLIARDLPGDTIAAAAKIHFTGSADPSIPVNWRFAEAAASLKGLEASIVNVLLQRKYGCEAQAVTIDTDHATLFM